MYHYFLYKACLDDLNPLSSSNQKEKYIFNKNIYKYKSLKLGVTWPCGNTSVEASVFKGRLLMPLTVYAGSRLNATPPTTHQDYGRPPTWLMLAHFGHGATSQPKTECYPSGAKSGGMCKWNMTGL